LIVEDDGVGRPADVADAQLVRFLANQLDADLDVESTRGTRYRLRFAYL
jgi:two-component sensor histidine kinase